jgi:hypothetical protein
MNPALGHESWPLVTRVRRHASDSNTVPHVARVERSDAWTTSLAGDGVGEVIGEFAARERMRVTRISPSEFAMSGGTHGMTRTFGLWVTRASSLPRRAFIETSAAPSGTLINARIEETWGPGYLNPRSKRTYDALFARWMQGLRAAMPALRDDTAVQGQDIAGQFARLAELHAQGVITDDEFSSAKASVMTRVDTTGSSS